MRATEREYQQCSVGVIDTVDDPWITFDEYGRSNYYHEYVAAQKLKVGSAEERDARLSRLLENIRANGKGRRYDCVIGVSGGVDSTYVALLAKQLDLRPLAVHLDNGWNSELAVQNIANTVGRLGIDLHTKVLNWEQFRELQLAYLRASVIDIEVITDHAIFTTLRQVAGERGIRYILSGTNCVTEQTLPAHWIHSKSDHVNIIDIHRKHGRGSLDGFPLMTWKIKKWYATVPGLRYESILNLVEYKKDEVRRRIVSEVGWRDYGGKHHESVFTRFYQCYILPTKFGVDKRKAHLSDLIYSGQMSKAEACDLLAKPMYDPQLLRIDKEFVLKKLRISEDEFAGIMRQPVRQHSGYETERPFLEKHPVFRPLRGVIAIGRNLLWGRQDG